MNKRGAVDILLKKMIIPALIFFFLFAVVYAIYINIIRNWLT